ncbi:unnamed protein product [Pleuronectes platessa]|uniref:Uncharacterized protein n=1 Tax=Pleuronectes platessa TaxID=8262 RepID=A0A9N7UBD3_PLEPL|nr:unnamed protein product [Pleuronectes platessa]
MDSDGDVDWLADLADRHRHRLPCKSETPSPTLTDRRGMFNCRLLRPAVIGIICHRARLAGRQEQAGVRGVTPSRDDDRTGAPAKPAAGPVLLLWSLGIPLLHKDLLWS